MRSPIVVLGTLGFVGLLFPVAFPRDAAAEVSGDEASSTAPTRDEAKAALERAVAFFRDKVGVEGGYVWTYSADLTKREGEGKVGPRTVWVQPPGTPFVGEAFVEIHELTSDRRYLEAAKESAQILLRGQLRSGGWAARIELDPEERRRFAYRIDPEPRRNARNHTALDDDMTQSALRFLMRYDRATSFGDLAVHEAVKIALESLLAAQYPNGAWPQGYADVSKRPERPVRRAGYDPDADYPKVKEYWDFYTLNDGVMKDVIDTLLIASRVYDEKRYREAALRGGEFLLLAQMPDPQPAWAQQYDFDMQPAWARRFEPPAISGGESQGVLEALLDLFDETGDRKWLEPVPRAIAYLRRSLLPDGRLARFYELRTNRPLYFTREYELTHDDSDLPTHYSFKVTSRLDRIEARLGKLVERADREEARREPRPERSALDRSTNDARSDPSRVRRVIAALDERGAWVEDGRMRYFGDDDPTRRIIDPRTFVENALILARYVGRGE